MAQAERMTPESTLQLWLDLRLDACGAQWLRESVASLTGGGTDRDLFSRVSLVSRKLGKAPLALDATALALADQARPGWDPSRWTVDQAARIRLLLASATDSDSFVRRLDQLCATADLDELVAFYQGLPLYPDPPRHRSRAAEGVRTNMRVVFEAVVHRNPYAAEQLPEDAWNQMVLKALFVGSSLAAIVSLDRRANATLARMLSDYAHERWSAGRPVSPELWRCAGQFASGHCSQTLPACSTRAPRPSAPPRCWPCAVRPIPKPSACWLATASCATLWRRVAPTGHRFSVSPNLQE